jgi:hypothetical protein
MLTYTIVGGVIVVIMSMMTDSGGTIKMIVAIITIRGITWLAHRIVQGVNKDAGDIINLTGWSFAGVSAIGILKNAIHSPLIASLRKSTDTINGIIGGFDKFATWIEKLTFWS